MTIERGIGEATTPQEAAIEAAIARVPFWRSRDVRYRVLVGGLSNSNWRVAVAGDPRHYFVKIPGPGTDAFVDRKAANEAARNAHALGIAPEVVFFDPSDGLEAAVFLDGYRACTNADFEDRAVQTDVIALYRRFNAGPPLSLTKTIFDMIDEHFAQARSLGSLLPPDFAWLEQQYQRIRDAFTASGLDLAPCFNDPMPGNFLVRPGARTQLIDYEFASNNERAYELGVLLGEMFFPEDRSLELIEDYYGSTRPAVVARVWLARALADLKWATWAVVNRRLSDWDFDYQKYGVWKYMRARSVMFDPRWEWWLRTI